MSFEIPFRHGLLDAAQPVPDGLTDGVGRPAGRRYAVYRNNVAVALREALVTGFPAVHKLIGQENFAKAASLFLRQTQPASPLMMHYGTGFPEFLASLEPLKPIGYLADIARLELALRRAYHAADAAAMDASLLQTLSEDALMEARFRLAPVVEIVRSPWPLWSIYTYTMQPDQPKPQAQAEDVLIVRPEFDPIPHRLPTGGANFVTALQSGDSFGAAFAAAGDGFDLPTTLNLLLMGGALTGLAPKD